MADRVNRREIMIDVAARLFMEHGYTATSVRQIAEEVGCTEAALYYHFKDGKRELLKVVVERNMPDLLGVVSQCQDVTSLHELILRFGLGMSAEAQRLQTNRLRWVIAEFPKFNTEERKVIHERAMAFHEGLVVLVRRFITNDDDAQHLTWMLIFLVFGYGQMMINMDLQSAFTFDVQRFVEGMAEWLGLGERIHDARHGND
jgi:AcrR family transcriptional regulator